MSRTVTRSLTALALGGLASLTMMSPASAAACPQGTYPPGHQCTPFTITVTVAADGQTITITVTGFKPGSTITIVIHHNGVSRTLGSFIADQSGNVTAGVTIPSDFPHGSATLTASGVGANGAVRILSSHITINGSGSGSGLPFTGFELGAGSLLGAGLLGAGTLAVVSGRKRKDGLATV